MSTQGRQQYLRHLQQLRAEGRRLIAFACPCCGQSIETGAAVPGESWDTLTDCPHCGEVFLMITEGNSARGVSPSR